MKTKLYYETQKMRMADLGNEASIPDLLGATVKKNLKYDLDEDDELYDGYGMVRTAYPYRQFSCYNRELKERDVKTVILENRYLKAVLLPDYGGRLWSLWDKKQNRDLLYTNSAIRFGNLAIRNAWFSGGVEWNISVIGHTPFTTSPLFTATLQDSDGTPVLRMYEYERIRKVTLQMDFWLKEEDQFLNARIRIVNFGDDITPMYWWSDIAVPDYENGRIVVPSDKGYTASLKKVYKIQYPMIGGVDVSRYRDIPSSVDYFFDVDQSEPKYMANVDDKGYGLLQMSTGRLQYRKLFCWGKRQASYRWQEFLSEGDETYIELQAGILKSQYGCIPMAPHTAWEWLERYGALQLEGYNPEDSFTNLRGRLTDKVNNYPFYQEMEQLLKDTREMAMKKADVYQMGSGYGALKNEQRLMMGKSEISPHLDFGAVTKSQEQWIAFLKTGELHEPDVMEIPDEYMSDDIYYRKLKEAVNKKSKNNWYAHYHLGLLSYQKERYDEAYLNFEQSIELRRSPWGYHGMASAALMQGQKELAGRLIGEGIRMRKNDLSYLKDGFQILIESDAFDLLQELYSELEEELRNNGRLKFIYIQSLYEKGEIQKAYQLLNEKGGLVVADVREGEFSIGTLWEKIERGMGREVQPIPYHFDFQAEV